MKTKSCLLLTLLLLSSPCLHAGLTSDTLSILSPSPSSAPIAGQPPVLKGMTTDPLGIFAPPPAPRPLEQLDEAGIIAILIGMLHGDDDSDTLLPSNDPAMAMWQQLTTSINGDEGADTLWGDNGTDSALSVIVGGGEADSFRPKVSRAMLAIYGEGGADSVHDSLQQLARFVMNVDRFTCDPMGDGPSLRPVRLQRVADAFAGDPWMNLLFPPICGGNGNDSVATGDVDGDGFDD